MTAAADSLHIFGIRHHGPGSAAAVVAALDEVRPAVVLIEGPPEASELIPLAAATGMRLPLAILTYPAAEPERARFYPYAEFSPEWQAMVWSANQGVPARFIDLPMARAVEAEAEDDGDALDLDLDVDEGEVDPLGQLAKTAGHADGESWWNAWVEQSAHAPAVFGAIHSAMAALREAREEPVEEPGRSTREAAERRHEALREAHMRQQIRVARKEYDGPIAVVCGAWHAPALTAAAIKRSTQTGDRQLLKPFQAAKRVESCWVPWTDQRLASRTGYGAGVPAPGWYAHLWRRFERGETASSLDAVAQWQTKVATALRQRGQDAATSSVLDATRLTLSLAALRNHPVPGLHEMRDASLAALCHGDEIRLRTVEEQLVVGERVGRVDDSVPQPPLQADLARWQKKLRLEPTAEAKEVAVDLRTTAGQSKSELFWRLRLIDVPWAKLLDAAAGRGTYREVWSLCWEPELSVKLAEALVHGATIEQASHHGALAKARATTNPTELAELVRSCLLANLPSTAEAAIAALQAAAVDVGKNLGPLMAAVPPLVEILRYGTARELPTAPLRYLVSGIIIEVGGSLVFACSGIDAEAATGLQITLQRFDSAVTLLDEEEQTEHWHRGLQPVVTSAQAAPRLRGVAARILYDRGLVAPEQTARHLSQALSPVAPLEDQGAWLEGFLSTSGEVLLHDDALLACVDQWLTEHGIDAFQQSLPMLRRALSAFDPSLRKRLLTKLIATDTNAAAASPQLSAAAPDVRGEATFSRALPLLRTILGYGEE